MATRCSPDRYCSLALNAENRVLLIHCELTLPKEAAAIVKPPQTGCRGPRDCWKVDGAMVADGWGLNGNAVSGRTGMYELRHHLELTSCMTEAWYAPVMFFTDFFSFL